MRKTLSTLHAARLLGVAAASVSKWIDKGHLVAGRTPGGHRRIEVDDLVEFIRRQKLRVPPELLASHRKILVVDDEEAVAKWLAEEIKAAYPDVEVLEAHDGFSAGELVWTEKPDAVVLDLRMLGMDGFEVCRRIKTRKETKGALVIAITASPSPEVERRILGCGAEACLAKPIDLDTLLQKLAKAVGHPK